MEEREYIHRLFAFNDPDLQQVTHSLAINGIPNDSVQMETAKLLYLLVKLSKTKRVLEIGSLGGYSSLVFAKALPSDGRVTSLELKQHYADLAKRNVKDAGYDEKVVYLVGDAKKSLTDLQRQKSKFDFFFIDADKENYLHYLEACIGLASPGAVITADNVLWGGQVFDPENHDPLTVSIRKFNEQVAGDPRLDSVLIPIGDGLVVAYVR
jgi:caffeoyl-CoA O-methyltransferase